MDELLQPCATISPADTADEHGNAASLGVDWWPVSCMQARLWMLHRLDESSTAYHMARGQWIDGPLNVPALERSLRLIVERHEVLRAKFIEEDGLLQQVIRPTRQVAQLDVISCKEADCDGLARKFVDRPFDLNRDPLIRVQLLHVHSRRHMLLVCMHHIVADGWSVRIVAEELQRAYNAYRANTEPLLPKLSVRYRDFVVEQDGEVARARDMKLLSYWREALQGAPPLLELPLDHPRPAQRSGHGAQRHFVIEQSLRAQLEALAMRRGVSLHMLLLAAFTLLLSRYSNQRDILVGTPVANRDPRWAPLVGMFVNTVPIRVQVDRDTSFAQYLTQVKRTCLAAYARQDLPFELLVEELQPTRTLSHVPLIQNVFMVNDASGDVLSLDGLHISAANLPVRDAKFDLLLSLELQLDGIVGRLEFQTDIYEAASIERFGTHYCNLLTHVVSEPDCNVLALPIVGAQELEQDYRRWNATEQSFDTSLRLHELFVRQARRTPSATALIFNDRHMSYAELLRRSTELAVRLQAAGAGRNELVAVVCDKGFEQVIAVMGVLLAGAAYMPIESDWPAERQTHLLAIGLVKHVVCQHHICARTFMPADLQYHVVDAALDLEEVEVGEDIRFVQQPDDLAYVIFTSGSTGTPKGVVIQHRAAVNTIVDMNARYAVGPQDRVLALSLLSFDLSVYDIFGVLGAGGALVIPEQAHGKDPAKWWALVQRHAVSLWNSVPALMQMMVDYLESERVGFNAELRWCFMSGDWIPLDLPKRIQALGPKIDVHSGGGATEASIWSITYPIREIDPNWRSIPYGKPLANQRFFVLNERLVPCPIGVTGDLYIGGVGLAHSYWRDEARTAERFITVPQSGQRLYKTGDLGRYLPDGDIEFMGRADRQVKVNGYRIELAEIEVALARCEGVKDAVACVRDDAGAGRSIAAYVTTRGPQPMDVQELRQSMQRLLPAYMVPSSFVVLDELPLTANGKVDGKRLPRPDLRDSDDTPFVLARDHVEASLCGAFRELLNVDEVGIHQDFFKLGGHSLSAARLTHRIRNALHVDLPVREVFVHTTVEALARRVRELARSDDGRPSLHPYADVSQVEPVSYAQYGLWIQTQFDPAAKAYNMPAAIRLCGSLNIERLEWAFEQILQRHESLRTRFVERAGELLQDIVELPRFEIRRLQWHNISSAELEQKITELAYRDASQPFDLEIPPLIRATLVTLAAEDHLLLFGIHHIVCDGWSYGVLLKELTTLYVQDRGAGSLPQLPVQYRHFSRWQRDWLAAGELERHIDYWERKLSGRRELRLPCASAPPGRVVAEGQTRRFHASEEITRELSAASSRAGTTRFVMLMAAFKVLMSWYDRHTDICVGTTVAGRPLPQLESMIGLFANQIVIRTDLSGDPSVRELAIRVHHEVMAAMEYQAMPYALLAERLCSSDATPLFRVKFVYETLDDDRLQLPGLVATPLDVDNGSVKFDLLMIMGEQGKTLRGSLQYRRDMFAERFIGTMLELWHDLLTRFAVSDRARLSELYSSLDQRAAQLNTQQGERGAHEVRSRS